MKNDVILAGVGGQGILTIAAIVGQAALNRGMNVKQSEVHGMAQRGGSVVAHLRLSTDTIFSDLIAPGTADAVLGVEPLEALRHADGLGPNGTLLVNREPIRSIPDYPDLDELLGRLRAYPRSVVIDAGALAKEAGSARAMNIVMLGALSPFLGVEEEDLIDTVRQTFSRKGEDVVAVNLRAFAAGKAAATRAW